MGRGKNFSFLVENATFGIADADLPIHSMKLLWVTTMVNGIVYFLASYSFIKSCHTQLNSRCRQKVNKCVTKMHVRQTRGVQLKLRATPSPPFQKQHFRRSLYDTNSTQGIENDVSARLPDITLDSCDRDL